jgi:hypothetical protein
VAARRETARRRSLGSISLALAQQGLRLRLLRNVPGEDAGRSLFGF